MPRTSNSISFFLYFLVARKSLLTLMSTMIMYLIQALDPKHITEHLRLLGMEAHVFGSCKS